MRRTLLTLALVCSIAGLLPGAASAALWLVFSVTSAAPGETVAVRTLGEGAFTDIPPGSPPLRVFLVRTDHTGVASTDDERLIPLGALAVDADGNGHLRFSVPDVPAGDYTTLTHCVACAPFSAGRELLPTGPDEPFVVLAGGADGGFPIVPVALAGGGLLLAALVFVGRRVTSHEPKCTVLQPRGRAG